jgi:geranylgeranyl diphosphate synthase type I
MIDDAGRSLTYEMLAALESDLLIAIQPFAHTRYHELNAMLHYHLSLDRPAPQRGKRVRPLLTLLCCAAANGDWRDALAGASAIELVHNFSLIHDDIEDGSEMRRGRPALWKRVGIAQAINSGDALFAAARSSAHRLNEKDIPTATILEVLRVLDEACVKLTQGQFLDLHFEAAEDISQGDYLEMVSGKTAALISAAAETGAILAGSEYETIQYYRSYGHHLGVAFQIQDDILGIWGQVDETGKPSRDDLRVRKKTLPVLLGLEKSSSFSQLWKEKSAQDADLEAMLAALDQAQVRQSATSLAESHTTQAIAALSAAAPRSTAGHALTALTEDLLYRER